MGSVNFTGITLSPLDMIETDGGAVMHALKATDPSYVAFGEAYFSRVRPGAVKAWKRHTRMTMNLVVPVGHIRFVFAASETGPFLSHDLGPDVGYARLTVAPGIWFGFQGRSQGDSMLFNLASIVHDRSEAEIRGLDHFQYDWN